MSWDDASYREQLRVNADHGVRMFSPLCGPARQNGIVIDDDANARWGVPVVPPPSPVSEAQVPQLRDLESAQGYSADPTYADRAANFGRPLPSDTALPSLALYHKLKAVEKSALAQFRGMETEDKRLCYVNPSNQ